MDRDKDAESIFENTSEAAKDMAATVKDALGAVTPPSVSGRITPTYDDLFASEAPVEATPMVVARKTRKKTLKTASKKAKKAVKKSPKQSTTKTKKTAKTVAKKRKSKKSKR